MDETLSEVKSRLVSRLNGAGIEIAECRREAQLIVEHITGWTLSEQVLKSDLPLPSGALEAIERILACRLSRMPLQYLIGYAYFMGLKLKVKEGVFIPRTDTEVLVEAVASRLQDRKHPSVFEIGTGSGAISIALLKLHPQLTVTGVDKSAEACQLTRQNAVSHQVGMRLEVKHCSWQELSPRRYDAVVSNPPYIPAAKACELEPEVSVYEPAAALWGGGEDGLEFYREFAGVGFNYLGNGGFIAFEFGDDQQISVMDIFREASWTSLEVVNDINGLPRVVLAAPDKSCFSNV